MTWYIVEGECQIWRFLPKDKEHFYNNIVHFSTHNTTSLCRKRYQKRGRKIKCRKALSRWTRVEVLNFPWDKSKSHCEISESPHAKGERTNISSSSPSPSMPTAGKNCYLMIIHHHQYSDIWLIFYQTHKPYSVIEPLFVQKVKEQTTGAKDQDSLHVRCAEKVLVAGVVTIIVASIDVSSTKTGGGNPRLLTYKSILLSIWKPKMPLLR